MIVVERDNLQLGTDLSKVLVGEKHVNRTSISCHLPDGSLKFCLNVGGGDGRHYLLENGSSYDSSSQYLGFDNVAKAKAYLKDNWYSHCNYDSCVATIDEA